MLRNSTYWNDGDQNQSTDFQRSSRLAAVRQSTGIPQQSTVDGRTSWSADWHFLVVDWKWMNTMVSQLKILQQSTEDECIQGQSTDGTTIASTDGPTVD